jgi:hypothetical protein
MLSAPVLLETQMSLHDECLHAVCGRKVKRVISMDAGGELINSCSEKKY